MPTRPIRSISAITVLAAAALLAGCGSSATTVTSPSTLTRCSVGVSGNAATVPAQGGSGSVSVTAARECSWSASVEGPWLTIKSGATGQGDGTVEYTVTANPDPANRRGAVVLNDQRVEITQAAGECTISLEESAASFPQSGGSGRIDVRASSGMCTWTAEPDANWIVLRADANGKGSAALPFDVAPSSGPPRTGTIKIAGQRFNITQSEGCAYTIAPPTFSTGSSGGNGTITVTTTPGCPWTAGSNVAWLSLSLPGGTGPGAVAFSVAPSAGASRRGTAVVAGQTFEVVQSEGCTYAVEPLTHSVAGGGGAITVNVKTGATCAWTAASDDSWIVVNGAAAGTGPGSVQFAVAASTGGSRTGTAKVAGQTVTVSQGSGCSYAISPETATVAPDGGTGRVIVTAGAGCAWSATSNAPWIQITSGSSGTGNGELSYVVPATSSSSRTGTVSIAGRTFTLTQQAGCSYSISPQAATVPASGGSGKVAVTTGAGCAWTATSNAPWIQIAGPAGGSGSGEISYLAPATSSSSRTGTLTIAGHTFTLTQSAGCTFVLSAPSHNVPAEGGTGTVGVSAGEGCQWSATSSATWLSITSSPNGSGSGSVNFAAAAHTGAARTATLTIGGQQFVVNQAGACSYAIAPDQHSGGAAGGTVNVAVTTQAGCAWSSSSQASWITVRALGAESGNGTVEVTFAANSGGARTGTALIAGRTMTVNQVAAAVACSISVDRTNVNVNRWYREVHVDVSAAQGCDWTARSNVTWIQVFEGASGSGEGEVGFRISANFGSERTGTLTIGGVTVTVKQGGADD